MAQYFTDFSEYTKDVAPSDWSVPWTAWNVLEVRDSRFTGSTGGAVLYLEGDSAVRRTATWDAVDADAARDDCEVVCRLRSAEYAQLQAVLRTSGTTGTETAYRMGPTSEDNDAQIARYVAGSFTNMSTTGSGLGYGAWHWFRARAEGTSLKVRSWTEPDPEPTTWQIETTDASITAAGAIGLFQFSRGAVDYDVFGVGTNGDLAPTEPVDPGGGTEGALLGPNGRPLRGPNGGLLRLAGT